MKERNNRKKRQAHPLLRIPLSMIAIAVLLFLGISAFKFCMSLFMTGDYIVSFPWSSSPVVADPLHPDDDQEKPGNNAKPVGSTDQEIIYATVSTAGDIMPHMPVVRSGKTDDGYDFDYIFTYLGDYVSKADYAAANLETTLSGTDDGNQYSGYPHFNTPDAFAGSAKNAGFDLILTGNEHCNDYGTAGLKRTLETLKSQELDTLGTVSSADEAKYIIKDLNGIQVGMICYTDANTDSGRDTPSINGTTLDSDAAGLLNCFDSTRHEDFYAEMTQHIAAMKEAGAEAIMLYIHWGKEYSTEVTTEQTTIAQKMCDLGVDVIVGNHSHAVQPVELLTSAEDASHKTVCLYSTGNLISNLRANNSAMSGGHTEDGLLFSVTFAKYADGTVCVDSIDLLPLWVLLRGTGDGRTYQILPLDSETDWRADFELSTEEQKDAQDSYSRTSEILNESKKTVELALAEAKAAREAA